MDIEEVREIGLSLPHTTERCPFGPDALALEIGGRMFCLLDLSGKWTFYNIKSTLTIPSSYRNAIHPFVPDSI